MSLNRTILSSIAEVVLLQTKYLRHYDGQVLETRIENDVLEVKCSVLSLGWYAAETAPWCQARSVNRGSTKPEVDDWVEIYFMNSDMNRPVWLGMQSNLSGPKATDTKDIIYEKGASFIVAEDGVLTLEDEAIEIIADGEAAARETDSVEAIVPANTFIVSVSGGSGGPAVGVLNPTDITLVGEITAGSSKVTIGG